MINLADHLDCSKLVESCVTAIETSQGKDMLSSIHGTNGALHWLLLSENYRLKKFHAR